MTAPLFTISFLVFVLCMADGRAQTAPPFDNNLISEEKELNFFSTEKRGIKADNDVVYFVESDGRTLTAYAHSKAKWKADVLANCQAPAVGKPEIRYIKLMTDKIEIAFGKHAFASLDITDGKVTCLGSD